MDPAPMSDSGGDAAETSGRAGATGSPRPGPGAPSAPPPSRPEPPAEVLDFDAVYTAHVAFVWRSLRRLGVPPALLEDATQNTFLVVHRRLAEFEGRGALRTWLFRI